MKTMAHHRLTGAEEAWWGSLPEEIRGTEITRQRLSDLVACAGEALTTGSVRSLDALEQRCYRLARDLEPHLGREGALRFLRDGLVRALVASGDPQPEALAGVVAHATDAIWSAHCELLEATIQRQQQERFRQELTLAKRIQQQLLPRDIPTVPGYDISGTVLPAAEIGGDYWSCKRYPEDDIVTFKLADITGHGIAAAMLVAAVKFISGGYYRGAKTAALVMERTNNVLVRETPSEILVTMVYGWLYPYSNEMSVVNAGHSPVLHYHDGRIRKIPPTGIALGMIETRYREVRVEMAPGDIFFTCSDGVTEPNAHQALGEPWVEAQLEELRHAPAAEIVEAVTSRALAVYGTPQDDMSVLVIKRTA